MNKKSLFGLFALATMLFTASCQEEDIAGINAGNSDVVTFAVNMKQAAATRADLAGRGKQADKLYYGVYEKTANGWALIRTISAAQDEGDVAPADISSGNVNVEIKLAKQKEYSVIFWATNENNDVCDVNWANRTMTMKTTGATANNEANDAFWAYETVVLNGAVAKTVDLYRPFAQLNIGASKADFEAAHDAQVDVDQSQIVLKKVANTFNMETGAASGEADVVLTYAYNDIPDSTIWKFPVAGHEYLAFGYVLVDTAKALVDVELAYNDAKGGSYNSTFTSVPVQRNYRTNIYGNLLSNSADYDVNLKPDLGDGENIEVVEVATAQEILEVIENLQDETPITIVLNGDIDLNDLFGSINAPATRATSDPSLTIAADKELILDMNNKRLSAISFQKGNNYNMFDVRGTLTLKNGTIEYKHEGENMGWGASTNLFNITAGGVVNLDGVTAKNLGGSDMAFVAHLNNWGEATLNVENSILESTYIAVRVFNSGYDMNNVTIKNSTLKGKYCFWVHNYKGAGDSVGTDETLNLDIYNNENTFECTGKAPILYGFADPIYYDAYGYEFVAEGVGLDAKGSYQIYNAEGLKWVAEQVNTMEHYVNQSANIFDGKVVCLANDIDLNGAEWTPIGDYAFSRTSFNGTFDGQGYTVSNFKVTKPVKWTEKVTEASYGFFGNVKGTIKNLNVENAIVNPEGGRYSAALVGRLHDGGVVDNCHVTNSSVTINHWQVGGLVGQNNNGNIKNCSVVGSTITGMAAVGAIVGMDMVAGEHTIENCRVANTTLVQNASFGESYDATYGLAVGLVNKSGIILHLDNVEVENNTIKGIAANTLVGEAVDGAKILVNGYEIVADGLSYSAANKEYAISSANGLVALSKMTIKGNERVVLAANIDLTGVEFTGLSAFNPESINTFDGQNHTVSNWTYTGGASDMGFFKSWVGNIKNVTFSNCSLKTAGRSAIVAASTYSNIENVHVVDCSIEDSYWACGLISGLYNSGNITNCSATNSSVKSNGGTAAIVGALNETAGTRSFTNCKVEGCTINNTGVYGEVYSGAAIVGIINISNSTVKFTNCEQVNNTFKGNHVYDAFHAPADEDITIVIE